ncbi:ExbD/TolR family protein [Frigidibacter sp. ROC022]|uniref:ExbD/TolR family protein n=1 Tax=Frigidibacter sp. ROC022 TaxID=2971796 RepID=UPI00215AA9DC|nr:biopolymer transporter ExbD [Frigidibacter sp. ROC022]MCR8723320.1 biopolymer transporter ExbD [Frigidibacter sp. ROC022]
MGLALTPRRKSRGPAITLVPMVDVMMILLVFFMVTSTYLDLDMVPAVDQAPETEAQSLPPPEGAGAGGTVLMVRIAAGGAAVVGGRSLTPESFGAMVAERLEAEPLTQIVLLPLAEAEMQALISVMDAATRAGATRLKVIRLEARP